jgi:hypothetical protein
LILSLGYNLPIESLIVFINPEFTLHQSPLNYPFLFPTQLNRYINKFESITSKLTINHSNLAVNKYSNLPTYRRDQLRKGITCAKCNSFSVTDVGKNCVCEECGHTEALSLAVMRIDSKKQIRRILDKNFNMVGVRQWAYYK